MKIQNSKYFECYLKIQHIRFSFNYFFQFIQHIFKRMKPTKNPLSVSGKKKQIRHKFTNEEDDKIAHLVEEHGRDWRLVASEMPGLNSRQCRERYVFYLDPTIANQEWSEEDMAKLTELVQEYGKTWTKITGFFPNRSVINVKNQWQKMMRHKHIHVEHPKKRIEEEEAPFFLTFDDFTPDLDLVISKTPDIEDWFF
ncbi:DNA-binding protein reb1 [Tritrichomonas foetus]|uniref:DNA-binding protein reb1 n=1 Tax=Tritrichomonas foetus TaxID=1144522 RepID=A0A1J4K552_9EUKA|nr:DNA-binding protein reb1 [Tritrichomonas foetus]|eukprot:OHT05992.1 DNA-binding protein reb1 [Tritrichomonas foetus]